MITVTMSAIPYLEAYIQAARQRRTVMKCYIGLDIGTSAVKGVLLSKEGTVLATELRQFEYCSQDL